MAGSLQGMIYCALPRRLSDCFLIGVLVGLCAYDGTSLGLSGNPCDERQLKDL